LDTARNGVRSRQRDLGGALRRVLVQREDEVLNVQQIAVLLLESNERLVRKPSSNQVRDSLRYLAQNDPAIEAVRDERNRLSYVFRRAISVSQV
jgi:hypothetical protein